MSKSMMATLYRETHVDEAVVEVEAEQRGGHTGVVLDSGCDGILDDGENGGARRVVKGGGERGGSGGGVCRGNHGSRMEAAQAAAAAEYKTIEEVECGGRHG